MTESLGRQAMQATEPRPLAQHQHNQPRMASRFDPRVLRARSAIPVNDPLAADAVLPIIHKVRAGQVVVQVICAMHAVPCWLVGGKTLATMTKKTLPTNTIPIRPVHSCHVGASPRSLIALATTMDVFRHRQYDKIETDSLINNKADIELLPDPGSTQSTQYHEQARTTTDPQDEFVSQHHSLSDDNHAQSLSSSRHLLWRIGRYMITMNSLAFLGLIVSASMITWIWFGDPESDHLRDLLLSDILSRFVTVCSVFMRLASAVQATTIVSFLAAIVIESPQLGGVPLVDAPGISIARYSNSGPVGVLYLFVSVTSHKLVVGAFTCTDMTMTYAELRLFVTVDQ